MNRLVTVTDALNHSISQSYDAAGNKTGVTDANNHTTTYTFDAINRMTAVTDPNGHSTSYDFDSVGNRTSTTDPLNHTTTYTYDEVNRVSVVTDAQNHSTTFGYDTVGNRTNITDAENRATAFTFDALNRLTVTTSPSNKTQTATYDNVGNTLSQTDEANQTTTFTYDAVNRLATKTDALNGATAFAYDNVGNLLTQTEPGNLVTAYVYDAANRVTSKTVPNGATTYVYDSANNLITLTTNSGARRAYSFDNDNLLTSETRYDAQNNLLVTYAFAYDATHNRTNETETRPNQSALTTTFAFDDLNRNISITDPYGGTTGYTFDAAGNLTGQTDPSGFTTSITPNASNLPETTVHRDENQNIVATTTNTFSNVNELQSATTTDPTYNLTVTNERTYNGSGYVQAALAGYTRDSYAGATTSALTYKDNNLLGTLAQQGQNDNHYLYDSAGRLVCSEWGGAALEYLIYEGNLRKTRYRNPGATCEALGTDPEAVLLNAWGYRKTTYTYEGQRLIRDEGFYCMPGCALNPTLTYTRTFGYDGDGNLNQLTLVTEGATTTLVYAWEPGTHHLKSVTKNGSVVATFEYDRLDRIRKYCANIQSNCHVFSYVGDSDWVSVVKDKVGNLRYRYLYANGRPLRVDIPYVWWVNPYYFVYTARGDYAGFIDKEKNGALNWSTLYGAWGDMSFQDGAYYTWNAAWGYMQFPSTLIAVPGDVLEGFYYAHGRWYVADMGLWLSPNAKGDYWYGGHGQDPVNVGWTTEQGSLPPLPKEKKGRYIRTGYGAIIDNEHFDTERPKTIIRQIENRQSPIPINGNLILGHALLDARYTIEYPAVDVYGVALAIYMDFQRKYETAQDKTIGFLPNAKLSSFAIEDLQTDYLGFYSGASGKGLVEIVNGSLGGGVWTDEDIHGCTLWILACQTPKNIESTPKVQVIERRLLLAVETPGFPGRPIVRIDWPVATWVNKPWPPELAEINGKPLIPITQGWRLQSCEITEGEGGPHLADCP